MIFLKIPYLFCVLVVLFAFDLLYCGWVALKGERYVIDATTPAPMMRSWVISAVVLGLIEAAMTTQTALWVLWVDRLEWSGAQVCMSLPCISILPGMQSIVPLLV